MEPRRPAVVRAKPRATTLVRAKKDNVDPNNAATLRASAVANKPSASNAGPHITFSDLSDDCFRHVLSFFAPVERLAYRKISKFWRRIVYGSIRDLVLPPRIPLDDFQLQKISQTLCALKAVRSQTAGYSLWGLTALLSKSLITRVSFTWSPFGGLRVVAQELGAQLSEIEWLTSNAIDADCGFLGTFCTALRSLKLSLPSIGDVGLLSLRPLTQLTSLTMDSSSMASHSAPRFTPAGLSSALTNLGLLQTLSYPAHSEIFDVIGRTCTVLKALHLDGLGNYRLTNGTPLWQTDLPFNNNLVNMVTSCTTLENLSLKYCNDLTQQGFIGIAPYCSALVKFSETFTQTGGNFRMDGPSLSSLAGHCPLLKVYISLGMNQLNDLSVETLIKNCPHMTEISLGENTLLTDGAFAHWPVHMHLQKVIFPLKNMYITDGSVGFVVDRCPNLHTIGLKAAHMTNKSFLHLMRASKLQNLELANSEHFTRSGIENFLTKKKIQRITLPGRMWSSQFMMDTPAKMSQFQHAKFVFV